MAGQSLHIHEIQGDPFVELTILMPCLNEALTVDICITKARGYLSSRQIIGEVLVADNGSTDGSQELAKIAGARVIEVEKRGYGAALLAGIHEARGIYVIMADADDSYDFTNLDAFVEELRRGSQLVVGNRFKGGISPGAMPLLNRYLGNPALSFIGRKLFSPAVGDFHCGLRGFDRSAIIKLNLRSTGMEFASEMVVRASLAAISISEVPTTLRPDGRQRRPHLRPWRDGWRHLSFMLLRSPQWLFFFPGFLTTLFGAVGAVAVTIKPRLAFGMFALDINALLYFSIASIVGAQIMFFGLLAIAVSRKLNLLAASSFFDRLLKTSSIHFGVFLGIGCVLTGITGAIYAVVQWGHSSFGPLVPSEIMRVTIPAVTTLAIGTQILFGALLLSFVETE